MSRIDPRHMDRLLSPERRRWQDPDLVLEALGVKEGMTVADIGSGPGFFTLPAAQRVGTSGKVYALDVEPAMLERVKERSADEGVTNVETLLSQEDRLPLPSRSIDRAMIVNVLHEVENPTKMVGEILRILKELGAVGVVEWKKEAGEWGPPLEDRLAPEQVEALLRQAGFASSETFDAGPRHYGILGRR